MRRHLSAIQERILLELSGQHRAVSVRDLCDVIGMDPYEWQKAYTDLYLADMIKRQFGYGPYNEESENPYWAITWIGEKWLADRPKPSIEPTTAPGRRWFRLLRNTTKAGE